VTTTFALTSASTTPSTIATATTTTTCLKSIGPWARGFVEQSWQFFDVRRRVERMACATAGSHPAATSMTTITGRGEATNLTPADSSARPSIYAQRTRTGPT